MLMTKIPRRRKIFQRESQFNWRLRATCIWGTPSNQDVGGNRHSSQRAWKSTQTSSPRIWELRSTSPAGRRRTVLESWGGTAALRGCKLDGGEEIKTPSEIIEIWTRDDMSEDFLKYLQGAWLQMTGLSALLWGRWPESWNGLHWKDKRSELRPIRLQ